MRNLTIRRPKKFTGCAVGALFFIESSEEPERIINGIPCRKLGVVKNGQEAVFSIPDASLTIFSMPPAGNSGIPIDSALIQEGTEDVVLTGEMVVDLGKGGFHFAGSTPVSKGAKAAGLARAIGLPILIGIVIGLLFSVPNLLKLMPKTFSVSGMEVTLTRQFSQSSEDGFDVCLDSSVAAVLGLKESFSLLDGVEDFSEEDYLELVQYANDMEYDIHNDRSHPYFVYRDGDYRYYCFGCKTDDAFWLVQFIIENEKVSTMEPRVFKWADTLHFDS